MGCCGPQPSGAGLAPAQSCKRVNYTLGMLLGVDDFVQESTYHGERRRELARALHGYGTVHGLQVLVEPDGSLGPRVRVTPGMAWLPSGTPVCVDGEQCANLDAWLAAHATEVAQALAASPPSDSAELTLYLVLSHLECLTDRVPIPGEPCRDESELMQPSRVTDGFRLELRLSPPAQREEDALRDFVDWLLHLPASPGSPPLDESTFVEQLRAAAHDWLVPSSPPVSPPDFMVGAAPPGLGEALFHVALRLWVTELRPPWMARPGCGCHAAPLPAHDDAVQLAELQVALVSTGGDGGWRISDASSAVVVSEDRRPVLLSLRMLQELILQRPAPIAADTVATETAFGLAPDPGTSPAYARADHTHGSPTLPALAGDVSGALAGNAVRSLQGRSLDARNPGAGQVLRFDGRAWVPDDLPAPPPPPPAPPAPAPAGDFVGRAAGAYEIVAAGEVDLRLADGAGTLAMASSYAGLAARTASVDTNEFLRAIIDLRAPVRDADALANYVVKLTPVWTDGMRFGYRLYLLEQVRRTGNRQIDFQVLLAADQQILRGDFGFRFQVEVSRFGGGR